MVHIGDEIAQDPFEVREIKEEAYRIEPFTFDVYAHAIVVAMGILALAFVPAQGVSGRKCFFHADFKHEFWLIGRPGGNTRLARRPHETLDFGDVPREAIFRQRFNENSTILHALDTVIEDGQHAAIGSRANQPAKALL
jgi:hypothetical protein